MIEEGYWEWQIKEGTLMALSFILLYNLHHGWIQNLLHLGTKAILLKILF